MLSSPPRCFRIHSGVPPPVLGTTGLTCCQVPTQASTWIKHKFAVIRAFQLGTSGMPPPEEVSTSRKIQGSGCLVRESWQDGARWIYESGPHPHWGQLSRVERQSSQFTSLYFHLWSWGLDRDRKNEIQAPKGASQVHPLRLGEEPHHSDGLLLLFCIERTQVRWFIHLIRMHLVEVFWVCYTEKNKNGHGADLIGGII